MSFYSEMANVADSLLKEFGISENAFLRKETFSGGTDESPGTPINKDYPVVVVRKVKKLDSVMTDGSSVSMIASNSRELIMSVKTPTGGLLAVSPAVGDKILFGSDIWNIEAVSPVSPGDTAIIYKLDISQ